MFLFAILGVACIADKLNPGIVRLRISDQKLVLPPLLPEFSIISSPDDSVTAAVLCWASGIHRECNHGSTRSTCPIRVHERTVICKSQLEPIIENPSNTRGAEQAFGR